MERIVNAPQGSPLLLYDGVCALCNGAVTFVLKRDRSQTTRFAPLTGETAARFLAGHPELADIDSMIWIDASGRPFTRSAAAIAIARQVGGVWSTLAAAASLVPSSLRDAVYDLVARVRYRLFGRYDACPVPPSEHRSRFLA
jgi:predicted DCC family thiol-disulfide oxidoreductase YuxK